VGKDEERKSDRVLPSESSENSDSMLHHPFARLTADRRSCHCFHYFRVGRYTQLQKEMKVETEVEMRILMEMEISCKMEGKAEIKITIKSQINERRGERRDHTESHKICMTLVHLLT
jgi:hypothetical protein